MSPLSLAQPGCAPPTLVDPGAGRRRLCEHTIGDPQRGEVEAFIRAVYRERFGAAVRGFAPVLVALRDRWLGRT